MSRGSNLFLAGILVFAVALLPALAEAKAGSGSSMGSRGSKTYQPNAARPIERSITPQPAEPLAAPTPRLETPVMPAARPSFFQRHPFVGGLLGGFVGAGIGSMLFGGHFFGGGMGGILSLLLQIALIFFVVRLVIGFLRQRSGVRGPETVPSMPLPQPSAAPRQGGSAANPIAFPLSEADLTQIERLLADIQAAWSGNDVVALRQLTSPEIAAYMEEQLDGNRRQGVVNRVEQVRLVNGDVVETWREGALDYATVSLKWSAIDYLQRIDNGALVEGDAKKPRETTEVWTVVRQAGDLWRLSAIQQV